MLDTTLRDLRYAIRVCWRAPGFTAVVSLVLALGIGATAAIFSVVNGVLLRPLAYPESEALISLKHTAPGLPDLPGTLGLSAALLRTYRAESRTFGPVGLWRIGTENVILVGAEPEQVESLFVSEGTLDALRVQPMMGRAFAQADFAPGSADTMMLTHAFWHQRYGANPSIVGQAITIDGRPRTVLGVMRESFRFLAAQPKVILPVRIMPQELHLGGFRFQGLARLRPGVSLQQADADAARMIALWVQAWTPPPGQNREFFANMRLTPAFRSLKQDVTGDVGQVLWMLLGTIGVVLLIACANVANLLLVRAEGRQHELAIRAALGAGWGRIAREMLMESLVLGLWGGVLGLAVAVVAVRMFVSLAPTMVPRLQEITIDPTLDPTVLVFTIAIALLSGLLVGMIPVVKHAGPRIAGALRAGGRTSSDSKERHRARNTLVVVQVALAVILLVGSGLMIRTFVALRAVPLGFTDPDRVQLVRIAIPPASVRDDERVVRLQAEMRDRLAAIPGVSAVSFANAAPLEPGTGDAIFDDDLIYTKTPVPPLRRFKFVAPGFFQTLGTPLVAGRDFTWDDLYDHRPVTIVSENLARELWGEPSAALGKRIREASSGWREIVGVAGNVRDDGAHEAPPTIVYWPALMEQFWGVPIHVSRSVTFAIRSSRTGSDAFLREIPRVIWDVHNGVPVTQMRTLHDVFEGSLARTSFTLVMLGMAAAMALLLGLVGIYGVIAYAVSQRTREIGIRVALGAPRGQVRRMFLRHGLLLAAAGVLCGLAGAAALTRVMTSLVFGISPLDPLTYLLVAIGLVAAAALASYLPAHRATTIDPVTALRAD